MESMAAWTRFTHYFPRIFTKKTVFLQRKMCIITKIRINTIFCEFTNIFVLSIILDMLFYMDITAVFTVYVKLTKKCKLTGIKTVLCKTWKV